MITLIPLRLWAILGMLIFAYCCFGIPGVVASAGIMTLLSLAR